MAEFGTALVVQQTNQEHMQWPTDSADGVSISHSRQHLDSADLR